MTSRPALLAAFAVSVALLSGCGNDPNSPNAVYTSFGSNVGTIFKRKVPPPMPAETAAGAGVTREVVAAQPGPVLYGMVPSRRANTLVPLTAVTGRYSTWTARDGISLTLKDGLLTATRGFGTDLMSADVDEPLDRLSGGSGTAVRVLRWLDGENHLVTRSVVCSHAAAGRETLATPAGTATLSRIEEHCANGDLSFDNTYWYGPGHALQRSHQWVTPEIGSIFIERLK